MTINQIQTNLAVLNAATPAPKKAKKPAATNGHTALTSEELLTITVGRLVAALNLTKHGLTTESLVASVHEFERPQKGAIQ